MKRHTRITFKRPAAHPNEQPRELAEEVRRQVLQLRATAPDISGAHAFRDALLVTARHHSLPVEEIEARLAEWARETSAKTGSEHYDAALAAWAGGDMARAAEKAREAALYAAASVRCAKFAAPESGEENTPAALSADDRREAVRQAAIAEGRAWMLLGQIEYGSGRLREALYAGRKAMAAALCDREPMLWVEAASQVAWILDEMEQHADAEPLLRSILRVLEQSMGPEAPEVAAALNNLGGLLRNTGRTGEAEPLYRRALQLTENSFGDDHPQTAICLNNLAGLLRAGSRFDEAEPLIRRALEIDGVNYGENHPSVALYLNNLASVLLQLGRHDEALLCFQRALEIDERLFGEDHPAVASDLENLAVLLRAVNRHSEAEPLLRRSLQLAERRYGEDHHQVAAELTHLSMLLCEMDRRREAGALTRRALKATLSFAARTGRPAPGTRLVGQAYRQLLARLGIPDEELPAMLFMMKREVEQESPAAISPAWLEDVMDEMGIPCARPSDDGGGGSDGGGNSSITGFRTTGHSLRAIRCILPVPFSPVTPQGLVRSVQPWDGVMNSKLSLREISRLIPHRGRKNLVNPGAVLIKWPAVDGWLAVADEAVRTAFASQCASLALEQHADFQDIARFLKRRSEMLLKLAETLTTESRCEERVRAMNFEDVLNGMKQAEERLSGRVRSLLSVRGLKLQMVKLLEQEYFFSQASQAQLKLAQMEKE